MYKDRFKENDIGANAGKTTLEQCWKNDIGANAGKTKAEPIPIGSKYLNIKYSNIGSKCLNIKYSNIGSKFTANRQYILDNSFFIPS